MDLNYPRILLGLLIVVIIVVLGIAASTSSAAFGTFNPTWEGASELRDRAETVNADVEVALNTTAYPDGPAPETVSVALSPDIAYDGADRARLREFVENGGTIVVADDFGSHANALLAGLNAETRINGSLVRDERYHFRSPEMPDAVNLSSHWLLTDVDRLTLNHGTVLESGAASVIGATSEFAYLDENRNDTLDDAETLRSYPVVTLERIGNGRVVVVSDPSLFINAMQERDGNRLFVENLFGAHSHVLLDYSHAARLPPLAVAGIIVRQSALLQGLLGLSGVAIVVAWGRKSGSGLRDRLSRSRSADYEVAEASVEELADTISQQNPEWDEQRVRRVTEEVLSRREERTTSERARAASE